MEVQGPFTQAVDQRQTRLHVGCLSALTSPQAASRRFLVQICCNRHLTRASSVFEASRIHGEQRCCSANWRTSLIRHGGRVPDGLRPNCEKKRDNLDANFTWDEDGGYTKC